jgi:hypothetical protein
VKVVAAFLIGLVVGMVWMKQGHASQDKRTIEQWLATQAAIKAVPCPSYVPTYTPPDDDAELRHRRLQSHIEELRNDIRRQEMDRR